MANKTFAIICVLFISACAPATHYYWGDYEELLYRKYQSTDGVSATEQIEVLLVDIEKAQAAGKKIAPGINLHLAMLYAQAGNITSARHHITAEEVLYPMSVDFSNSVFKKVGL